MDEQNPQEEVKTDEKLLIPGIIIGVLVFGLVTALLMIPAFKPFEREGYMDRSTHYQDYLADNIAALEADAATDDTAAEETEAEPNPYIVDDAVMNPARGDEQRIAMGKVIYDEGKPGAVSCTTCHLADGSGAAGPSLKDDEWFHAPGEVSDAEMFRYVAFASLKSKVAGRQLEQMGQMQSYQDVLTADDIWNVLAYIETLSDEGYTAPNVGSEASMADEAPEAGDEAAAADPSNA